MGQPDPSWHQWLAPLDNVWIPSYIAYGLVDTMAPFYGVMAPKGKGSSFEPGQKGAPKGGKAKSAAPLAPDEQEFHQEMLRKLALHLAAQPDGNPVPGPAGPGPGAVAPVAAAPAEAQEESPERVNHFCECANFFLPKAGPEQNFHHEMLKKLALHLAAQPGEPTAAQMPIPGAAGLHARGPTTGAPGATSACLRAVRRASAALAGGAAHGALPGSSAPGGVPPPDASEAGAAFGGAAGFAAW